MNQGLSVLLSFCPCFFTETQHGGVVHVRDRITDINVFAQNFGKWARNGPNIGF